MEEPLKEILDNFVQDVLTNEEEIDYLASLDEMARIYLKIKFRNIIMQAS